MNSDKTTVWILYGEIDHESSTTISVHSSLAKAKEAKNNFDMRREYFDRLRLESFEVDKPPQEKTPPNYQTTIKFVG